MKILIIAYYYPPETYAMMASLRPHSWAKYWSADGHDVRVLTTAKNCSPEELAPFPNVKIEEVPYASNPVRRRKSTQSISASTNYQPSFLKKTISNGLL